MVISGELRSLVNFFATSALRFSIVNIWYIYIYKHIKSFSTYIITNIIPALARDDKKSFKKKVLNKWASVSGLSQGNMIFVYTTRNQEVMRCNEYTVNFCVLSRARAIKPYVRNRRAKKVHFSVPSCRCQSKVIYAKNKNHNGLQDLAISPSRKTTKFRRKLKA